MQVLSPFFKLSYAPDGALKMRMEDLPPEAWEFVTGGQKANGDLLAVDWLYRAVQLRAAGLAQMPFTVSNAAGDVIDTSDDWRNTVGWLNNPYKFFYLTELALTMTGRCYWLRTASMLGNDLELQYLTPASVREKYDKQTGALAYFERNLGGGNKQRLEIEDVLYFWYPDYNVEIGPGRAPVTAAMAAAGVLLNLDKFAAMFFERGAIKATVLGISGNPNAKERERLKSWWGRVASGIGNAWAQLITNADTITPVTIGEGIESLSNSSLTEEKRQGIATALGIPQYKLFSEATNRATAEQADRDFYNETIIPEARIIAAAINAQMFPDGNTRLNFEPETMDIFQSDEQERAAAFALYTQAGLPVPLAAEMLGLDLPQGWTYERLAAELTPAEPAPALPAPTPEPVPSATRSAMLADLERYEAFAVKRVQNGGKLRDFESAEIPAALGAALAGALEEVETVEEVRSLFADARRWGEY